MESVSANGLIRNKENVNHPKHYTQGGIECIDAIKAATVGKQGFEATLVGNVIKYLWRYESKGGIEDIEKALWYLSRLHKEVLDKILRYRIVATENGAGLETPWHTVMSPKQGDIFNQNQNARAGLLKALLERGGYCPCQPNQSEDTMCPCKNYREDGKCICGLFTKVPPPQKEKEVIEAEEVKNEDAKTESVGVDSETEDSKEQ
jgi:ferredoxin-thioredoxin reductase catalytic subunit